MNKTVLKIKITGFSSERKGLSFVHLIGVQPTFNAIYSRCFYLGTSLYVSLVGLASVVKRAECAWTLTCWNNGHRNGSICCSQTCKYHLAFKYPRRCAKLPMTFAVRHPPSPPPACLTTADAAVCWKQARWSRWSLAWRLLCPSFSDYRTVFQFASVHLKLTRALFFHLNPRSKLCGKHDL